MDPSFLLKSCYFSNLMKRLGVLPYMRTKYMLYVCVYGISLTEVEEERSLRVRDLFWLPLLLLLLVFVLLLLPLLLLFLI